MGEARQSWRSRPGVLFGVLFAINVLNYTDRFVLPAVASSIKLEFSLSDSQIGLLGTAFLLVYAVAALPAGTIADRYCRTTLIAGGVAFWSVATLLTGITQNFTQLFGVRALLGVGEATYFPPSTTLLADSYSHRSRARMMSWWGMATPLGVFLGFGIGGTVGGLFGWRSGFFITAIPGLILAVLITRLRNPARGASESLRNQDDGSPLLRVVRQLLSVRTLLAAILAQALSFFVLGGVSFWVPTYLALYFQQNVAQAGILSGAVIVLGGGLGTIGGGYLADRLLGRGFASARLLVPAAGFLMSAPFIAAALQATTLPTFLVLMFFAAGFLQASSGPLSALSQDVIVPARRARAVAISLLLTHLLGDAFAPFAIGSLSDAIGSLQHALLVTSVTIVAAAVVGFYGCRFVAGDRERVVRQRD
jgi:MFS transporter, Spinster family, sphingosine-1-phosphate transporter